MEGVPRVAPRVGVAGDLPLTPRRTPALISVVLPVRNGEPHIAQQLSALASQDYSGEWELVVVDNGCTDRSMRTVESFRDRLAPLRIVDASSRRGLGRARNAGASAARGELLAYCDADDVVSPGWLSALAQAAAHADLVGGSARHDALNSRRQRAWEQPGKAEEHAGEAPAQPRPSSAQPGPSSAQPGLILSPPPKYGFLPYVSGGNCAIWADVARTIRWDESFVFGGSDIEFAWRAQLAGFRLALAPKAVIQRRFRGGPVAIAQRHFRYGMAQAFLFRRFRAQGMPRSDTREALQTWRWLWRNSIRLLSDPDGRGNWLRLAGASAGRIYASLRWRAPYL